MRNKHLLILGLILLFALFVRLIFITGYDIGSYWDEGYFARATESVMSGWESFFFPTLFEVDGKELFFAAFPGFPWLNSVIPEVLGVTTLTLRITTVIFGVMSVLLFYNIILLLFSRKKALISALVFASFPLHVAFSRVTSPHIIELFFFLMTLYLLVLFWKTSDYKCIYLTVLSLAASILVHGWLSLPLVIAAFAWIFIVSTTRRTRVVFTLGLVLLAAAIPLVLYINHASSYYSEHKDLINPFSRYDDIKFAFYLETGYDYLGVGGFNLLQRLAPRYLNAGHLTLEYAFTGLNIVYLLLFIVGFILSVAFALRNRKPEYWLFVFLMAGFLPIHLSQRTYLQHIIIITPALVFFAAEAVLLIKKVLRSRIIGQAFLIFICVFFLSSPLLMIFTGNEILYQTNYEVMGKYVKPLAENYTYSAIVRYAPTFSYYTHKIAKPTDGLAHPIAWYVENNLTGFVEIKTVLRDNTLKFSDYKWVVNNCESINYKLNISNSSIHQLYDCRRS